MILLNVERSRIFPNFEEKLFLALPFFFVGPILYELIHPVSWTTVQIGIFRGLAASLFLNTTHVGMTLAMMFAFPRVSEWKQERFGAWSVHWSKWVMGSYILLLMFYLSALNILPALFVDPVLWKTTVLMGHAFLLDWHGLGQSKGLTLIYNHRAREQSRQTQQELQSAKKWASLERILPPVFLILSFSYQIPKVFNWHWPFAKYILMASYVPMVLMFVVPLIIPGRRLTNKVLFNFRFLLWPLALTNIMASVALASIHGFEYLFVYRQMFRENKWQGEVVRRTAAVWTVVACGLVFLLSIFQMDGFASILVSEYGLGSGFFRFVTAGLLAFGVIHCVWDRIFFRFSNELGRKFVAPLILGDKKADEQPSR